MAVSQILNPPGLLFCHWATTGWAADTTGQRPPPRTTSLPLPQHTEPSSRACLTGLQTSTPESRDSLSRLLGPTRSPLIPNLSRLRPGSLFLDTCFLGPASLARSISSPQPDLFSIHTRRIYHFCLSIQRSRKATSPNDTRIHPHSEGRNIILHPVRPYASRSAVAASFAVEGAFNRRPGLSYFGTNGQYNLARRSVGDQSHAALGDCSSCSGATQGSLVVPLADLDA